jgi:hypothetical protein
MATVNRAALEEHIRELRDEVSGAGLRPGVLWYGIDQKCRA